MTALVLAALAGLSGLLLSGSLRPWPWRVVDLTPAAVPRARRPAPRSSRRDADALARDLPAAVDLLHLAATAGLTLHDAVAAVAQHGRGPVARALAEAVDGFERGGRLVDELERLPARHGSELRPLTTTLVVASSSGAPVAEQLARLAAAERRRARRRIEARVRRLPVLLLVPLVGLVLPAFVCLTVVPVGITTARVGLRPAAELVPSPDLDHGRSPP